jgi:threonyl-tRNA synthetase
MKNNLDPLRHSTAHLLAAAVLKLWPKTKLAIGPAIENGFYYDFDFEKPISGEDLPKIEAEMEKIVKTWKDFKKTAVSPKAAKAKFETNPYKKELIEEFAKQDKEITLYQSGEFVDLCKGGHVENPSQEVKAFKLLSLAGAYWRGSEKNPMLTRLYGTVWPSKTELDDYLLQLEEAKERDHRKIGKDLGLFVFSDLVGKGLPLLTAKGATIRRVLERFIVDTELKLGYQHVLTPPLANLELYKTSGHYPYYKDTMYPPMKVDDEELILRPMTCPHHFMLYKSEIHSYRELPIKLAEIAPQFRYEKSGELSGLMRVRMFTLSDAHVICRPEQAKEEIIKVLELIDHVNKTLGLEKAKDYRFRLSLGNRTDTTKYYKDDSAWDNAEKTLREVLVETKAPFYEEPNEAAFYGPKIDIQMKNALGKEETAFTIQYDFVQPKRFDLSFINEEGKEAEVVVIHRSSIGAFERIMAFLIEHYTGKMPTWLSPIQIEIIPIADRHLDYANEVKEQLLELGFRVEVNGKTEPMGAKIRDAQLQKIPYMLVVGDREQVKKEVAVRDRDGKNLGTISVTNFVEHLQKELPKI